MTKLEADEIAKRIIMECNERADEIVREAKAKGIWKPGLDSNRALFEKLNEETKKRLEDLKKKIDVPV